MVYSKNYYKHAVHNKIDIPQIKQNYFLLNY